MFYIKLNHEMYLGTLITSLNDLQMNEYCLGLILYLIIMFYSYLAFISPTQLLYTNRSQIYEF